MNKKRRTRILPFHYCISVNLIADMHSPAHTSSSDLQRKVAEHRIKNHQLFLTTLPEKISVVSKKQF